MVTLRKRIVGNKEYYYLVHSSRKNGKVEKAEQYVGTAIPKNIEQIKRDFTAKEYRKIWFSKFDAIKENFLKETKELSESIKEKNFESFSIRFTYDTNKIEGSTLTLKETAYLLEKGIAPKKPSQDIKEAESHKNVFYDAMRYKRELSLDAVLYWHKKLFESTKPDIAGKIRKHQVAISGSRFTPPLPAEMQPLLNEFFTWYHENKNAINPVELAALSHLKFVTIHPFGDGNGRISRLLMNFVLHKRNFPMMDVPYEKRIGYYNALERSQIKEDSSIFIQWFFRRYLEENKKYC